MKQELCLIADWDRKELKHTALKVVSFFGVRLQELGTDGWIDYAMNKLPRSIEGWGEGPAALRTPGFDLVFYGPNFLLFDKPDEDDGFSFILEDEPRFVVYDRSYGRLLPSQRSEFYRGLAEIFDESAYVYKLNPVSDLELVFPREEYSKNSGLYSVPNLGEFVN